MAAICAAILSFLLTHSYVYLRISSIHLQSLVLEHGLFALDGSAQIFLALTRR